MSLHALEQRVTQLERKVVELEAALKNGPDDKAWLKTFGTFKGDETMKRIYKYGQEWREAERRKARRRKPRKKKTKV